MRNGSYLPASIKWQNTSLSVSELAPLMRPATGTAGSTSDLTPGYFDLPAGSSARRGAALPAAAVAAVRAVFDLRRSRQVKL